MQTMKWKGSLNTILVLTFFLIDQWQKVHASYINFMDKNGGIGAAFTKGLDEYELTEKLISFLKNGGCSLKLLNYTMPIYPKEIGETCYRGFLFGCQMSFFRASHSQPITDAVKCLTRSPEICSEGKVYNELAGLILAGIAGFFGILLCCISYLIYKIYSQTPPAQAGTLFRKTCLGISACASLGLMTYIGLKLSS